ncbi:MAG: T9SS type A sorting domain-containing protein [Bacteroidales bacterium]|nr:T9SS type A sorting domain-containing protein [Bacteroidales bacterium]
MTKFIPFLLVLFFSTPQVLLSQTALFERQIVQNGGNDTIELSNGQIVIIATSSDDAEQEQDAMDALYDDDLDIGWEGDPEKMFIVTAGFRFQNIFIPAGATIDSAYIVFCSHEGKSAEDTAKITIYGEASDNPETFDLDHLITDRPSTAASVYWQVQEEWGLWEFYHTPELKSIIQEIIDRPGWAYGNALALIMTGQNQGPSDLENAREVEAFENIADPEDGGDGKNHPERVPMLKIFYTAPTYAFERRIVQNGGNDTIELSNGQIVIIATSSDDAEQEQDAMDALYDDDLDIGWEGDPEKMFVVTAGLRFQNIAIPPDATIDSAFVVFCSHEGKSAEDTAKITIYGEASDNAQTYNLEELITSRPATASSVYWQVQEEWGLWEFYRTPELKSIIQEIIDRPGWAWGNALALVMTGENQGPSDLENAREVEAFENIADPEDGGDGKNHPERVPQLLIYYKSTTGIDAKTVSKSTLHVYPNPASDYVTVVLPGQEPTEVSVLNTLGNQVMTFDTPAAEAVRIELSSLPAGIYVIMARQGNAIATQKLMVK